MDDFIQPRFYEFKNIYLIKGDRNGNYPYSHSLLIEDLVIDTGISSGHIKKVKRQFPINSVILSHWHEDHISGNHLLNESKFFCHKKDMLQILALLRNTKLTKSLGLTMQIATTTFQRPRLHNF